MRVLLICGLIVLTGCSSPVEEDLAQNDVVEPEENRVAEQEPEEPEAFAPEPTVEPIVNSVQMSFAPPALSQFYDGQVKHIIPLDEVLSGGPPKDGIPSIDHPKFLLSPEVDFLDDEDLGILLTVNGNTRFYPYKILTWHEIVNDTIGGEEVVVTYCPLCASGVAFSRLISTGVSEFGVSGMLYQSNLLMYDRSTQTLWDQLTGEAVVGQLTGEELHRLPSDIVRYGAVRNREFDVYVLSKDTGFARNYDVTPYAGYDEDERIMFPTNADGDQRLHAKELIYGVAIDGKALALTQDFIRERGAYQGYVGGGEKKIPIHFLYDANTEQLTVTRYFKDSPGQKEIIAHIPAFWFSWLAQYPETVLVH